MIKFSTCLKEKIYIMKNIIKFLFITGIIASFAACVDLEYETPTVHEIPEGIVYTVEDLQNIVDTAVSYTFKEDASVYALVTGDETSGNIYKSLYIESNKFAINLHLTGSAGMVRVGDSIRVVLKDAIAGKYAGNYQIDNLDPMYQVIKKEVGFNPEPTVVTIPDLETGNYNGRLVKIVDVQFDETALGETFADAVALQSANRDLMDCNGNSMIVRTSGYADFAGEVIEGSYAGKGTFTGIATEYNGTQQLLIRNVAEVALDGERCGGNGGGDVTAEGTGTKEDPYNVAGAIENNTGLKQWVKGYIVGTIEFVEGGDDVLHYDAPFGNVETNLMIANSPEDRTRENLLIVKLESGEVRNILNLSSNAGNAGKEVMLRGDLQAYFGQAGMKQTIGCIIDETAYGDTEDIDAILYEDFASIQRYGEINLTGWKVVAEKGTKKWQGDGYNGQSAEMSAYDTETPEAENTTWLITPAVDLSATAAPSLSFYSALKYFAGDILKVYVSTDYSGGAAPQDATWTELVNANIVTNSDPVDDASGFNYVESGDVDLSAYKVANVSIAFKYVGSGVDGQTTKYRIDNIKIADL